MKKATTMMVAMCLWACATVVMTQPHAPGSLWQDSVEEVADQG